MAVLKIQSMAGTGCDRRIEILGVGEEHLRRSRDGCELWIAGCEAVAAAVWCVMFCVTCQS